MKEKELFPPLKKYFNELGFKVFTEVPNHYRSIDFVAVRDKEQIAVEMKISFTKDVVRQASMNTFHFLKSYVAIPKRKINENNHKYDWCISKGIGILQVYPLGTIFEFLKARKNEVNKLYDFSTFEERDGDEAGIPFNRGVSVAYVVLDRVKKYVTEHPTANWEEIYQNVQNHYSHKQSMAQSMTQWKGFSLVRFKESLEYKND